MSEFLHDIAFEFRRHKRLADDAIAQLSDEQFFRPPAAHANSVAIIVKHVAGNLRSRWSDLLHSDGEKSDRDRDAEFEITENDTRTSLTAKFALGWDAVLTTMSSLTRADLDSTITIRGEPHTVRQAILRGLTHTAYHVGQILYLVRLLRPDAAWQTIPPGQSGAHRAGYRNESPM